MINPIAAIRELIRIPSYHRAVKELPVEGQWEKISYGDHERQYCLHARQEDQFAPTAVWFHGGGWQFGYPENLLAFGEYFFRRGYNVWMPSHRRVPRFSGSEIYADAKAAMKLIERISTAPPQLLLGGMSSGGQLASLLALRQNEWLRAGQVRGLISAGAPLCFESLGASPTRRRFAGRRKSQRFQALNPVVHLTEKLDFPAVILHGTDDGLVPWSCAQSFVEEARRVGWDSLKFCSIPGGTHLDSANWIWENV